MTNMIDRNAALIAGEIPNTEARIDDALLAVSNLISTLVQARLETGVPAATGQASLIRLAKAQMSLVSVSSDVLRVHGELLDINKEFGGLDVHECPKTAQADQEKPKLSIVA